MPDCSLSYGNYFSIKRTLLFSGGSISFLVGYSLQLYSLLIVLLEIILVRSSLSLINPLIPYTPYTPYIPYIPNNTDETFRQTISNPIVLNNISEAYGSTEFRLNTKIQSISTQLIS